jgi:hypothetical protein
MEHYGDQILQDVLTEEDLQRGYVSTDVNSAENSELLGGLPNEAASVVPKGTSSEQAKSADGKALNVR